MNSLMEKLRKAGPKAIIAAIAVAFVLGFLIRGGGDKTAPSAGNGVAQEDQEAKVLFWTCSMHPQIKQPGPGKCPLCGMDLIPVQAEGEDGGGALGEREIKLSPHARKLAEIEESPVVRRDVSSEIRMVGKVEYDERRLGYITAWVPGRIDKLHVDFTGTHVNKGDPMVYLYSPEIYSGQQELIEAWRAHRQLRNSGLSSIRSTAWQTVEASREKLRLLGLSREQVRDIERKGKANEHITILAPVSGVVIHKNGFEGMYVETGTKIYTIADLSKVWTKMDAYESDLIWLRPGQEVEVEAEAYPGEVFTGKVEFIDPFLGPGTRTAKVRITIPNPDGKLKPGMFVHGVVKPSTEDVQRVTGELGEEQMKPLIIPDSAPLITGKRAVVYVADPKRDGVYEGREIVLGPRVNNYYVVKEGLEEGEMVVTNGNFKIDSAIQIMAKPSMMSPEGGAPPGHDHGSGSKGSEAKVHQGRVYKVSDEFKLQLDGALSAYFTIQMGLAEDNPGKTKSGADNLLEAMGKVDMGLLKGDAHMEWMKQAEAINKSAKDISKTDDLTAARAPFNTLSIAMHYVIHSFGPTREGPVYRLHCPMAFGNQGADWLQDHQEVDNSYFGQSMLKCGEVVETISPKSK